MRWLMALVVSTVLASAAGAEESPKPPPPTEYTPIPVNPADSCSWTAYQLLGRMSEMQQQLLRLQNEKTLSEEWQKLDRAFREHYKIGADQVERKGEQWVPRTPLQAPSK